MKHKQNITDKSDSLPTLNVAFTPLGPGLARFAKIGPEDTEDMDVEKGALSFQATNWCNYSY